MHEMAHYLIIPMKKVWSGAQCLLGTDYKYAADYRRAGWSPGATHS
jgi:hypothetical protein